MSIERQQGRSKCICIFWTVFELKTEESDDDDDDDYDDDEDDITKDQCF